MATGTWSIGGYKLPDYHITETLANWGILPKSSTFINPVYAAEYQAPAITGGGGGGGGGGSWGGTTTAPAVQGVSTGGTPAGYNLNSQGTLVQSDVNAGGGGTVDPYAALRGEISGGWDTYINSLDQQLGQLPGQRSTLESQAQTQATGGQQDITGQQNLALQDIEGLRTKATENQVKSLKDVGSNIGNLMNAGQVMLGSRGAGDSSAANMYSYALTKMGSKERGNVMGQTKSIMADLDTREGRLNEITNQEKNKLTNWLNTQLGSIAQWFQTAQQSLTQQKGVAGQQKSSDLAQLSKSLLDQATQMAMYYKSQHDNLMSGLNTWAANHSTDINSLRTNLQAVSQLPISQVQAQPIAGMPAFSGNNFNLPGFTGYGAGSTPDWKKYPNNGYSY